MKSKQKMSYTVYLQRKDNPGVGRKVEVMANSYPDAQKIALKDNPNHKLLGYSEDYMNTED